MKWSVYLIIANANNAKILWYLSVLAVSVSYVEIKYLYKKLFGVALKYFDNKL